MTAKSVLIELDSIHSSILQRYIDAGVMPNLARVAECGMAGDLAYEVPLQISAWASAHTGLSAAEHGICAYDKRVPGTYRIRPQRPVLRPGATYWEALGDAGKRVLVVNNVNGVVTPEINGIHLCGWSTHVTGIYTRTTSWPKELAAELCRRFPDDLFHEDDWGGMAYVDARRMQESILANLDRKAEVYGELLAREAWDHVHLGFDDVHAMSHVLWHVADPDPEQAGVRLFPETLAALDSSLGVVLDAAGSGTTVIVTALAGIGPRNTWSHMIDRILARYFDGGGERPSAYGVLGRLWGRQPHWVTSRLLPLKSALRERHLAPKRRRSKAFAMPLNEESGAIRINLNGREPDGRVEPGAEYDAVRRELDAALRELCDTETGLPLVLDVVHMPAAVTQDNHDLPDMFLLWNRAADMTAVESKRLGRITREFSPARSGDHHIDGALYARGPALGEAPLPSQVSVLDIVPTIAAIHGLPQRREWQGRIIGPLVPAPASDRQGTEVAEFQTR